MSPSPQRNSQNDGTAGGARPACHSNRIRRADRLPSRSDRHSHRCPAGVPQQAIRYVRYPPPTSTCRPRFPTRSTIPLATATRVRGRSQRAPAPLKIEPAATTGLPRKPAPPMVAERLWQDDPPPEPDDLRVRPAGRAAAAAFGPSREGVPAFDSEPAAEESCDRIYNRRNCCDGR